MSVQSSWKQVPSHGRDETLDHVRQHCVVARRRPECSCGGLRTAALRARHRAARAMPRLSRLCRPSERREASARRRMHPCCPAPYRKGHQHGRVVPPQNQSPNLYDGLEVAGMWLRRAQQLCKGAALCLARWRVKEAGSHVCRPVIVGHRVCGSAAAALSACACLCAAYCLGCRGPIPPAHQTFESGARDRA